jgi:hypothetical protein
VAPDKSAIAEEVEALEDWRNKSTVTIEEGAPIRGVQPTRQRERERSRLSGSASGCSFRSPPCAGCSESSRRASEQGTRLFIDRRPWTAAG